MKQPKIPFKTLLLTVALGVAVGMLLLRPMLGRKAERVAPAASGSQFPQLLANLNTALASRDPYLLAQQGQALQTFEATGDSKASGREPWRRQKLELWLLAVEGVRGTLDPAFDLHDRPSLNLSPMTKGGVGSNSGMDPAAIRDSRVQADYERRLAENARKVETHTYQLALRRLNDDWTQALKSHVDSEYDTSVPSDRAEVTTLIDRQASIEGDKERLRALLVDGSVATASLGVDP